MGAGGWRFGAGRPGWKGKAESCRRIDVRRWAKEAMLRPGCMGAWQWRDTETGEVTASIGYRIEEGAAVLDYSLGGESRRQRVPIQRTTCHYGGTRPWFACPQCWGRVAVLFLRRGGFYCRKCARVAYRSQSEDAMGRAWRVQRKVEARLGPDYERPKGMHWRTYERLLRRVEACEEARDFALLRLVERMGWIKDEAARQGFEL